MAAVTTCSDFGAWKIESVTASTFPPLLAMKWWDQMPCSSFFECWVSSQPFHSPLSPSSKGFWVPLHFLPVEEYHLYESKSVSCSVVSNSLQPRGLQSTRLFCPRGFPGKHTGVGCYFLLHGIFPTQGLNPGLPHCRQILYHLSHQGCHHLYIWGY